QTCLAKDPDDRWQSAHDIGNQLRWIAESTSSQTSSTTVQSIRLVPSGKPISKWIAITAFAAALVAVIFFFWPHRESYHPGIETRFVVSAPPGSSPLIAGNQADADFAVSPDGTKFVYPVSESGLLRLYLRLFASNDAHPIPGTESAHMPFWSPDGQQIAFITL